MLCERDTVKELVMLLLTVALPEGLARLEMVADTDELMDCVPLLE